ncbi:MAG: HNH endonuclease [Halanaerobiales bacterium]|nr:HNH endonuclease [Halanaerobiales bacterium]
MIDEKKLRNKYLVENKPMWKIALELDVAIGSVYNYMKKYNIKSRQSTFTFKGRTHTERTKQKLSLIHKGKIVSEETKKKISLSRQGKYINPTKYGGHAKIRYDGYIAIYIPTHPFCNKDGYVMEHVLVMEEREQRYIEKSEVVHHINKNRRDNRIENLKIMSFKEHASYHMTERHKERRDQNQ